MQEKTKLLTKCGQCMDGKTMFFDKNTNKIQIYYSYFFSTMSQTNYAEKKCVVSIRILLRVFLLVWVFFLHTDILF